MYFKNYKQPRDLGKQDSTKRSIGRGITIPQRYLKSQISPSPFMSMVQDKAYI